MALTPAAAELSKELTRVLRNITKRNTHLKQKVVKGANLVTERTDAKIEEIRSMPRTLVQTACLSQSGLDFAVI